jgi:hypothetical protein
MVNGVSVCSPDAAGWVKKLQDALNDQPGIHDNFGPAYFSVTEKSGARKFMTIEDLKARGVLQGCTDIYVSIE